MAKKREWKAWIISDKRDAAYGSDTGIVTYSSRKKAQTTARLAEILEYSVIRVRIVEDK